MKNKALLIFFIFILTGCSFAPQWKKPALKLPKKENFLSKKTSYKFKLTSEWWKDFHNPYLNQLISLVLKNNDDLKIATARLEEIMAFYGFRKAELFPTIGYGGSFEREKIPESIEEKENALYSAVSKASGVPFPKVKNPENTFQLLSSVSFELDFWGKLRNAKKAAFHTVLASQASKETIKLSLISTTVELFYTDLALQRELKILKKVKENLEKMIKDVKIKEKLGLVSKIDVYYLNNQLQKLRKSIIKLENMKKNIELNLLFLAGKEPNEISKGILKICGDFPKNLKIPSLLPSELLLRRPDIIEAEEELKAANFSIGVARAMYFPSITLTGAWGTTSNELKDLIDSSSVFWKISTKIAGPLIDFGRTKSYVKHAEARKKEALFKYIKTVKKAFKEVYEYLNDIQYTKENLQLSQKQLKNLQKILDLTKIQKESGLIDNLYYLQKQNDYLQEKIVLIKNNLELLKNYIKLYKALGGGFEKKTKNKGKDIRNSF